MTDWLRHCDQPQGSLHGRTEAKAPEDGSNCGFGVLLPATKPQVTPFEQIKRLNAPLRPRPQAPPSPNHPSPGTADQLPRHGTGTQVRLGNWWSNSDTENGWKLSALVGTLPFMEQQAAWERISNPLVERTDGQAISPGGIPASPWPAMGPTPDRIFYPPWATEIPTFRCPSDPGYGLPALGRTNYAVNLGDSFWRDHFGMLRRASNDQNPGTAATLSGSRGERTAGSWVELGRAAMRGAFMMYADTRFRDFLDGTSNTILMGEIATDLGDRDKRTHPFFPGRGTTLHDDPNIFSDFVDPQRPQFWLDPLPSGRLVENWQARGFSWADFFSTQTGMHTILAPNREAKSRFNAGNTFICPPSSRHQGGVHVLLADGAVRFITDSIEAGNSSNGVVRDNRTGNRAPGSPSPYGLWGALGTRASSEVIGQSF